MLIKALVAGLLVLVGVGSASSQATRTGSFKFDKKQGSHHAVVMFETRAFEKAQHRVTRDRDQQTRVDGRFALGTDGNIPTTEIGSMRVSFDGKNLEVPKKLYADCFEPNLNERDLKIKFEPGFQGVLVSMLGSDGAGAYQVTWRLRKNGNHTRSITHMD